MKKVIVSEVEQVRNGRDVVAAVPELLATENQDALGRQPNTSSTKLASRTEASRRLWHGIRRVVMRLACRAHTAPAWRTARWNSMTAEMSRLSE